MPLSCSMGKTPPSIKYESFAGWFLVFGSIDRVPFSHEHMEQFSFSKMKFKVAILARLFVPVRD